jgi:type IV secretion system protein VirB2
MSGPVLQSMLILAILVSGVMIAFTEVGAGAKRLLQAVFGLSIAAAAVSFFPAFFNFAGAATF